MHIHRRGIIFAAAAGAANVVVFMKFWLSSLYLLTWALLNAHYKTCAFAECTRQTQKANALLVLRLECDILTPLGWIYMICGKVQRHCDVFVTLNTQ